MAFVEKTDHVSTVWRLVVSAKRSDHWDWTMEMQRDCTKAVDHLRREYARGLPGGPPRPA